MRISVIAAAVAVAGLSATAQAQRVPVWRFAQDQQFTIPKCVAPAKLTEIRDAQGRMAWRCVAPR